MARQKRGRPVTVEVETERVEGTIELADIVRRVERTATSQARAAKRDPEIPQDVEDRIRSVKQLAGELAGHLEELSTLLPPDRSPSAGGGSAAS